MEQIFNDVWIENIHKDPLAVFTFTFISEDAFTTNFPIRVKIKMLITQGYQKELLPIRFIFPDAFTYPRKIESPSGTPTAAQVSISSIPPYQGETEMEFTQPGTFGYIIFSKEKPRYYVANRPAIKISPPEVRAMLQQNRQQRLSDLMIVLDKIDSFSKVVEVDAESIRNLVPLSLKEEEVKKLFQEIIGEPFSQKDWGGERSDLFTTRIQFKGRRQSAAFIFKGKAFIERSLMISDLGTRGDQVIRLFTEPAKIYFLQSNGRIDSQVYDMVKTYAEKKAKQEEIFYCVIDGVDTARVLKAYSKL